MKEINAYKLDENDIKTVDAMHRLGCSRAMAKILIFLNVKKTAMSRDLEFCMDLRQPEVSIEMKHLLREGIITRTLINNEGKGRPIHEYHMQKSMEELVEIVEKKTESRIKVIQADLERLKKAVGVD